MIQLIPSLTVMDGKNVRIVRGNYNDITVYNETPLEAAIRFEEHGLDWLHLVDLDGSRQRRVANYDTLELISNHTQLKIEFGGGIETDGDISKCFEYGAQFISTGSIAARNRDLFASWVMSYGRDRIVLSADWFEGNLKVRGEEQVSDIDLLELVEYHYDRSLLYLKCTDIDKSGTLQGVNTDLYRKLVQKFPDLRIMASGGVKSIDDIKALADVGVWGVVFGKAYYSGAIDLKSLEQYIAQQGTIV